MKAVVVHGKGDLRVEEIADPDCGPDQVLVEMEWGGICGSDISYWQKGASGTAVPGTRWSSATRSPVTWPPSGRTQPAPWRGREWRSACR